MITPADVAACQADQLSAMWDRCIIRHPDSWAGEVRTEGAIAWSYLGLDEIPCRVTVDNTQPRTVTVGGETMLVTSLIITLPVAVAPVEGQVITVLSAAMDPALVGGRFDVQGSDVSTFVTARRVRCIQH